MAVPKESRWALDGPPLAPTVVVEIGRLDGEGSQFIALDHKMGTDYLANGVQLGWLIDPHPGCRRNYEYRHAENGSVARADEPEWRDLDGGDVLPDFRLRKEMLAMSLDVTSASSADVGNMSSLRDENGADHDDEEEQDQEEAEEEDYKLVCPVRRCGERFGSMGELAAHLEIHRQDEAIAKYKRAMRNQAATQRAKRKQRTK